MVTFGVAPSYGRLQPDPDSHSLYREMRDIAILADQLGFEAIWLLEHHLMFAMQSPNALLSAVHLAGHVKCRVGTAVCVLPYRHPLIQAGEIAAADNFLDGRLEVGVGRGAFQSEFERFGMDFSEANDLFLENLDVIERLLSEDQGVAHDGKFHKFPRTTVWPRPAQKPRPPMWFGAQQKETIAFAVRKGYSVMHSPFFSSIETICDLARYFHKIREEEGLSRDQVRFGVLQPTFLSDSASDCRRIAEHMVLRQRLQYRLKVDGLVPGMHDYSSPEPAENEVTPETVMKNTLVGSPEQIIERIRAEEEAGVDHIMLQAAWTIPFEDAAQSIRLFAKTVMGRFKRPQPDRESRERQVAAASTR